MDIKVLLINLLDRPKRLHNAIKNLKKINLAENIIRIDACDKKTAKKIYYKFISEVAYDNITKKLENTLILPTWGSVGCAISHIKSLKYIMDNKIEYAIIVEDDIEVIDIKKFLLKFENIK